MPVNIIKKPATSPSTEQKMPLSLKLIKGIPTGKPAPGAGPTFSKAPTKSNKFTKSVAATGGKQKDKYIVAPSELAVCRALAGGSLIGGVLLYRVQGLWLVRKNKLKRKGKEWIAHSRADWGKSSGLTMHQVKDVALPVLRKHCGQFLTISTMKLAYGKPNEIWMSLDIDLMKQAKHEVKCNWQVIEAVNFGKP